MSRLWVNQHVRFRELRLGICLLILGLAFALPALTPRVQADGFVSGDGFDTCEAPNTSQMAYLKAHLTSNNEFIGIYTGGVTRSCAQPNLSANWVTTEKAAGWDMVVLWAGYQDPCLVGPGSHAFSITPSSAFTQGTESAANAISADGALGFGPTGVFALDIEGYAQGPYVNTYGLASCEAAALAYQAGFDSRVNPTYYSETYGSSAGSDIPQYAAGYPSGQNIPDYIFFAEWNGHNDTNSSIIPSSEWINAQRIHQYDHDLPYSVTYMPTRTYDPDCAYATLSGNTDYYVGC